jgi:coproporphyrinogen III oxidase-like Fe-S oxidoreductase
MTNSTFDDFFRAAPADVDVTAIRQQWQSLAPPYDVEQWLLPLPVWLQRNYDDSGARAWEILQQDLTQVNVNQPFCIYLHIPFCSSKCSFCDCYSFKLGSHREEQINHYINHLCDELHLWSRQGNLSQRPVSTIHLGGGTPTFLGEKALSQIIGCCHDCFVISPHTELALESTVESLTPGMMATMHQLGFRRLHLGVQSLQEPVRAVIQRRRPVSELLARIESSLTLGWVVSIDLVCGLPLQTVAGLVADIKTLVAAGVNGFSLYELLIYPQNLKWAATHGLTQRSHLPNYLMFQAGASVLMAHGFQKNVFNHWADSHDKNVYFTFPTRGEDCLAVGTIGDGVFGDYHFRHPRYATYLRQSHPEAPGLEGGLRRTPAENDLLPLTTAVLSGHIPLHLLPDLQRQSHMERWQRLALVEPDSNGGLTLTTSGAWFAGNMIRDLASHYPAVKAI